LTSPIVGDQEGPSDDRRTVRFGVLLPHFGATAGRSAILDGARLAEESGFDSVWARDHVVYRPHAWEDQDSTFVDPFVTLAAVAAVTHRVSLGFAVLAPYRHPVQAAVALASLDFVAGPGRVIAGLGLGSDRREFEAVGAAGRDRRVAYAEYVDILRGLWSGKAYTSRSRYFPFTDVCIRPVPDRPIPIWYGSGAAKAGTERVAALCDGVFLATTRSEFAIRRDALARAAEALGRPVPTLAASPLVVPHGDDERLDQFLRGSPEAGFRRTAVADPDDGAVISGSPDAIAEAVQAWMQVGVDHFVFNLRLRHDQFPALVEAIGRDLLPRLR
jgi:alkanesulfonate monooxygenase SsuD/methylene tetrahydromethanopterin reductase-like flavin-dependent oxidoreductase (luciferase family)